jgi:hypothetical protein
MSEQVYRLLLGVMLWAALIAAALLENMLPIFALVTLLLLEWVTNYRLSYLISRIRYGTHYRRYFSINGKGMYGVGEFDAERTLRLVISGFVLASFYILPDYIWFMSWFVAGMLLLAGITNICPMLMFLRWVGLR